MEEKDVWEGTPTELLTEFENIAENLKVNTKSRAWPKDARWVWRRIQEILPNLEAKGIKAERGRNDDRNISLQKSKENDVDDDDNDVKENKNDAEKPSSAQSFLESDVSDNDKKSIASSIQTDDTDIIDNTLPTL